MSPIRYDTQADCFCWCLGPPSARAGQKTHEVAIAVIGSGNPDIGP